MIANLIAIFRKELQSYFYSPFAYIIAAVFWLVSGFFFSVILDGISQDIFAQEQLGASNVSRDAIYEFLNTFLGVMISLLLVLLPALSMGLYAEERKRGTLELLATSPIQNWIVALGKLLGVVTFFTILMIPIFIYEVVLFSTATPPVSLPLIFVSHGALLLLVTAILSLGMFVSSLTDISILSYILTFILVLFLWMMDVIAKNTGGILGKILEHLSLFEHYNDLVRGVFNVSSIVLFVSYIFLGLFLTAQSIDALRFQRS